MAFLHPTSSGALLLSASRSTTMGANVTRLWGYALAELIPITRQRLHLPDLATNTNAVNSRKRAHGITPHRSTLDRGTTRRLLDGCSSRSVPLESALLASLFLAAVTAARTAEQTGPPRPPLKVQPLDGERGRGSGRGAPAGSSKPLGIRVQRASVLGIVSVVMALLSGSVDSKALRYFCSIYAVFAGVWAVNTITVEVPGFIVLMATRATNKREKVGRDGRGPTFTPVRLTVDCRSGLWDTAGRHGRQSRGTTALSEKEFARFRRRVRCLRGALPWFLRGRGQRRKWPQPASPMSGSVAPSAATARAQCGEPKTPLQLFACIELDASLARSSPPAPRPQKAVVDGDERAGLAAATAPAAVPEDEPGEKKLQELLFLLDARYTLLYRVTACDAVETLSAESGSSWVREGGDRAAKGCERGGGGDGAAGGAGSGRPDETARVPAGRSHDTGGISLREQSTGGLELTLVNWNQHGRVAENACRGKENGLVNESGVEMLSWLLERATAILVDAVALPATAD